MLLLDPFLLFIFVSKMSNIHSNVDKTSSTKIIGLYLLAYTYIGLYLPITREKKLGYSKKHKWLRKPLNWAHFDWTKLNIGQTNILFIFYKMYETVKQVPC